MQAISRFLKITFAAIISIFFAYTCSDKQSNIPPLKPSTTKLEAIPQNLDHLNTPEDGLKALKDGNQRFMNGQFEHIHIKRISANSEEDPEPFVGIITCSDCKIPPEILFDQDNKFVMVIKTPANVEDEMTLTKLNAAVEHQALKLIMVLGHNDCRAIKNVLNELPGDSTRLSSLIAPAIDRNDTLNLVDNTARKNVKLTMQRIPSKSRLIDSLIKVNKLKITGAFYDAKTGRVIYDNDL